MLGGTKSLLGIFALGLAALGAVACPPYGDAWMRFGGDVRTVEGQPVSGARVELRVDRHGPKPDGITVSNAEGHYQFFASSCPCDFTVEVVAAAPGFRSFRKSLKGRVANRLERLDIVLVQDPGKR